jgi:hypothetical protein
VAERSSVECDGVNSVLCDVNVLMTDSSSNLNVFTKSVLNDGQAASDKTDPTNILNHPSSDVVSAIMVPLSESQNTYG